MFSASTAWLLILFSVFDFGNSDIIVTPQNFTVKFDQNGLPANNLTVVCTPPAENNIKGVIFIQLRKRRSNERHDTPVATATPDINDGYPVREVGLDNRDHSLSGEVSAKNPMESFLRVEFHDASCIDEGDFECRIHFYRDGARQREVNYGTASVTTKSLPEQVVLLQRPAYDSFIVNQTVELHCSAQVGSPPAYYRWQYRHTGHGAKKQSDFQALTFGVTHSEGPFSQGFCKYFRSGTLWVRANLELDGVEIRCLLARGTTRYYNISASFTFKVKEAGCIPDCWNGGICEDATCRCPLVYTGSFCEQPVDPPCKKNCDDTSAASGTTLHNICKLVLMLVQLSSSVFLLGTRAT